MLSPEYLFRLAEGAEDIAAQLHSEIIKKVIERIVTRLERGEKQLLTVADKWQIETLQDAGYLRQDIQKELAKLTKTQLKEIRQAFEDAGIKSYNYDSEIYKKAGLSVTALRESPQYIRLLQAGHERTAGEWRNFTRTFADQAQKLFISECDRAYHLVSTGATSYSQAIADAVEKIATEGVTITYPSGHTDTVETATARAVRTGVAQACGEITEARLKDMNWDIILVSAHLGARLGDGQEDYTNHYWWQGKFYSYSGKDERFPPFDVCGVGDVQGLCGANCRHSYGAGDGVNNPYEEYDKADNIKRYEIEQRQRTLERRIRKTKRECMGLKQGVDSATDKTALQDKYTAKAKTLKRQVEEYNTFCKENDLKRRSERLQIAQWDRAQTIAVDKAAS